jgi:hypothetical protein
MEAKTLGIAPLHGGGIDWDTPLQVRALISANMGLDSFAGSSICHPTGIDKP